MSTARPLLLVAVLSLSFGACGGTNPHRHPPRAVQDHLASGRLPTRGPPAIIPAARPLAMTETPRAQLAFCRRNPLLRPVCPRRIPMVPRGPASEGRQVYYCGTGAPGETARQTTALFATNRCESAEWGYEVEQPVPGYTAGSRTRLSGWNGRRWTPLPPDSGLVAPPLHVHVDIEASRGGPATTSIDTWPRGAQRVSDTLLNPGRRRALSLGWAHWYGRYGQLVLAPAYPRGGVWGDHLIYFIPPNGNGLSYTITLHTWMAAVRLTGAGVDRTIRFQSGPALPHAIATLKSIVGSALAPEA